MDDKSLTLSHKCELDRGQHESNMKIPTANFWQLSAIDLLEFKLSAGNGLTGLEIGG